MGDAPLFELQKAFAAHIRDPERAPRPGDVEDRRMAIYRELFYNNIQGFLAGNFPVIHKIHDDERWQALVRDFYARHRAHTPLFPELPREFLRYLQDERGVRDGDPPFLLELAHYEWVELALTLDENELDAIEADADGDLLAGVPVFSPLAWPLSYAWPVHQIRPEFQPSEPPSEATHLLVNRDRHYRVRFLELNPVTARLVTLLKADEGLTGLECLERIATELGHPRPDKVIEAGSRILADLRERDVVLGTRN